MATPGAAAHRARARRRPMPPKPCSVMTIASRISAAEVPPRRRLADGSVPIRGRPVQRRGFGAEFAAGAAATGAGGGVAAARSAPTPRCFQEFLVQQHQFQSSPPAWRQHRGPRARSPRAHAASSSVQPASGGVARRQTAEFVLGHQFAAPTSCS
jgi:hypothetical protein